MEDNRLSGQPLKTHKDLDVWKNSVNMVTSIYQMTEKFPKSEIYGLTNQIRRSAVSIPSNIAEGAGRFHKKEFIQFLYIALGSIAELETQIIISNNLKFISDSEQNEFEEKIVIVRKQLSGLIKYLKR